MKTGSFTSPARSTPTTPSDTSRYQRQRLRFRRQVLCRTTFKYRQTAFKLHHLQREIFHHSYLHSFLRKNSWNSQTNCKSNSMKSRRIYKSNSMKKLCIRSSRKTRKNGNARTVRSHASRCAHGMLIWPRRNIRKANTSSTHIRESQRTWSSESIKTAS